MREKMRRIPGGSRTIAHGGASAKPERAGHSMMAFPQSKGYPAIPVDPGLGRAKPSMPACTGPLVDDAVAIGAKYVRIQIRATNFQESDRGNPLFNITLL